MQLLLIDKKSLSPGCTVGDVVGVFPDSHQFSPREYDIFRVVRVDMTAEGIDALRPVYPEPVEGEPLPERPRFELHFADGEIKANG